ncbi:hypothetical protein ANCDUO_23905 [Ancylostoma duodenale]|uniref:Uncharacterized protein n=1 Tax=Ancylostoma duodenale TaxID=51022 RepID=A0A0C2FH27_9BILA|nr:hypothetical protein ANCDUO_23905 [Ancylostoma duodenale]
MYRLHIYMDSEIGCKLFTFLAHLSDFICVWMISWISWVFMFAGLEEYKDDQFCGLSSKAQVFGYPVADHYFLFTLLDTAICTLLPAILIMFVNSLSIYRYRQCMRIYSSGVLREETTAKKLLLSQTHTNTHTSTQSNRSACGKLRSSDLQLSRTLLIVTSTFVLLNVPSYMPTNEETTETDSDTSSGVLLLQNSARIRTSLHVSSGFQLKAVLLDILIQGDELGDSTRLPCFLDLFPCYLRVAQLLMISETNDTLIHRGTYIKKLKLRFSLVRDVE